MDKRSGFLILIAAYIGFAARLWPDQLPWILGVPAAIAVTAWLVWTLLAEQRA